MDSAEPRSRAAHRAATQHPTTTASTWRRPPFQNNPSLRRALSMVIDRERLAKSRAQSGRASRLRLGASRRSRLHAAELRLRQDPHCGSHNRSPASSTPPRAIPRQSHSGSSFATTQVKYTTVSPSRSRRCGKKRLGAEVQPLAVEFKSLLQDIDRGDVDMFRSSWLGDYNDAYTLRAVPEERLRHQPAALSKPGIRPPCSSPPRRRERCREAARVTSARRERGVAGPPADPALFST